MKKRIALLFAALLAVGSLATACGGNGANNGGETVKVGLGAYTSFKSSYSVGELHYGTPAETTNAQVDITVAAVTLDANGKVVACQIDAIQVKGAVDATGAIADSAAKDFTSKYDLKEGYNMKGASPIGAEWFEQIDVYELWCVGKTVDEIKAGVNADGYPTDATLLTGCTIKTDEITLAVVDACQKAVASEAKSTDTLGISLIGKLEKQASATAEKDGTFQAYVNFACTTQNAEGKITSVLIDSIQAKPTWGTDGVLTTDANQDVRTKYTKKGDYGMQVASTLTEGEWYQQIDVFKTMITGKTAAEVSAIAVDDGGYPTDDTLRTGCTMKVADYKTVVVKSLGK